MRSTTNGVGRGAGGRWRHPAAAPGADQRRVDGARARAAPPPAPRCPSRAAARARRPGSRAPDRRRRPRPSSESTTSRSTRSTHGPSTCSTTTSVGECVAGWLAAAPAPRRPPAPPARTPGRASRSARRGGRPTGRARASRRARAAGSARPTAPTSGCRAARSPSPTGRQRGGDDTGHGGARHPDVLRPERDVPPDGGRDHPGARLLQHEPDRARALARRDAVDGHRAVELTGVGRLEQAGERPQEGGLARPRGPDEQHALPGPQGQGDVAQHRVAAAERPPGEPVDLDPAARDAVTGGTRRVPPVRTRGQTAWDSRCSWPAGKADSAPARASARTRSQPTSPASTAPETAIAPR